MTSPNNSTHGANAFQLMSEHQTAPTSETIAEQTSKMEDKLAERMASMESEISALHSYIRASRGSSEDFLNGVKMPTETRAPTTPPKPMGSGMLKSKHGRTSASFLEPFLSVDAADVRGKYPAFAQKLSELYPGALPYDEAAVAISHVLREHGFQEGTSLAMVSQCRDELTKPFTAAIDHLWGGSFNISSLAGAFGPHPLGQQVSQSLNSSQLTQLTTPCCVPTRLRHGLLRHDRLQGRHGARATGREGP